MISLSANLTELLLPLANAQRAAGMAAYMKHRFAFLGVQTPERRRVTRSLIKNLTTHPLPLTQALWAMSEREYQYVACDLLRHHVQRLEPADLPALEALVCAKSWWDTVDSLAQTVGELVRDHPHLAARMDALIDSDNLWLRRVAILHQLQWKSETDQARLFDYCRRRAGDQDFFIRKALGWALRQYARTAPQAVAEFLHQQQGRLSALTLREAGKHLAKQA